MSGGGELPEFLAFKSAADLIRLGTDHDGGYLVSSGDVRDADFLLSMGINDDWSFESDFIGINDVPLMAIDGSISKQVFWKKIVSSCFRARSVAAVRHWIRTLKMYSHFFRGNRTHLRKFVGNGPDSSWVTMEHLVRSLDSQKLFIKMDIEGSEYDTLDDIVRNQDRIIGLVIEFHHVHTHLEKIRSFVSDLSLGIVHIHANNFAKVCPASSLPTVLEVTFSAGASQEEVCLLPHPLDMPNDAGKDELHLRFATDRNGS